MKNILLYFFNIWLNYAFGPHFRSKISIWSLYFYLSQFSLYFGKFDAIKPFLLVVQ